MSESKATVLVKDSDMISAKSLLQLLSDSIDSMKKQYDSDPALPTETKLAIGGAIEAMTDLHNLVLSQLNEVRLTETFESSGNGGKLDS